MLVAAVRAGDDGAFEQLYERYQRRIGAYVYGMVHDHGRAEDVTQEVFISALRRLRATDAPIVFKPWLYEIAKNACIDVFRRSKRAEEVSFDAEENGLDSSRLVSSSPTPDAAVDQRLTLENLQGAFGGLSEAHHQILVMRELEGLSYRQIGERLGLSRPSVESTLFRARRRLTEEYDEIVSGERCRRVQAIIADSAEGRLGVRDGRRMARHVSHCQPCRRAARLAGVDLELAPRSVRERLAALLPLPGFLRPRSDRSSEDAATGVPGTTLAQWTSAAAGYADPVMSGWARAAAVAAGVAVAGVGAGVATHDSRADRAVRDTAAPLVRAAPAARPAQRPGVAVARSGRTAGPTSRDGRTAPTVSDPGVSGSATGSSTAPADRAPASSAPDASQAPASASAADPLVPQADPLVPQRPEGGIPEVGSAPATPSASTSVPGVERPATPSVPSVERPAATPSVPGPAVQTPSIEARPSVPPVPSLAAPSTSVKTPAVVGDTVDAATDAATATVNTVGSVTSGAGILGGG